MKIAFDNPSCPIYMIDHVINNVNDHVSPPCRAVARLYRMFPFLTPPQEDAPPQAARRPKPAGPPRGSDPPPHFRLADLAVRQSDGSGRAGLQVRICDLPTRARFITTKCSPDRYHFQYRPQADQGHARLSVPALGIERRPNRGDELLLIPPGVQAQGEWAGAAGRVVLFLWASGSLQQLADRMALPAPFLKRPSLVSVSIDWGFDALCRLLMEETEARGPHGPLYFEALARALMVSLLGRVCGPQSQARPHAPGIPPGIEAALRWLEGAFGEPLSVPELARRANLSVDHFARSFEKATGLTPHRYLLQVRLSHARALMTRPWRPLSLAEIAVTCGFADQAHFGRHFRCFFGMTPTAFLRAQAARSAPHQPATTPASTCDPGSQAPLGEPVLPNGADRSDGWARK
jgi:AraC family transcriptional regulator